DLLDERTWNLDAAEAELGDVVEGRPRLADGQCPGHPQRLTIAEHSGKRSHRSGRQRTRIETRVQNQFSFLELDPQRVVRLAESPIDSRTDQRRDLVGVEHDRVGATAGPKIPDLGLAGRG